MLNFIKLGMKDIYTRFVDHWKIALICCLAMSQFSMIQAQEKGSFSGGFQSNGNIFLRDSLIGASDIPQYDHQLYGADAWLDLGFAKNGFKLGVRFDLFNNSNLLNPNGSYTDQGIGKWFISKKIDRLDLTAGYIYDQIGSGIIFRSFEERPQLIDNALIGARAKYNLTDNWQIKAFTGQQRNLFSRYPSIIKGASIDGFLTLGENNKITLAPGFGYTGRTLDEESMTNLINIVKNYIGDEERFKPEYNVHMMSLYNTMGVGPFVWYLEAAYKSEDTFFDPTETRTEYTGDVSIGRFVKRPGSVVYSSLSYAGHGLGLTLEGKRTENFNVRTEPTLGLNRGFIGFLPPMNRLNTYRMTTRYSPATQDLSELAFQVDALYRINKQLSTTVNMSSITTNENDLLYRELYTELTYKYQRKWQLTTGLQIQRYNQEVYEVKPNVPIVETFTPFVDFLYKMTRKKSIRTEFQYMLIGDDEKAGFKQDFGDWIFGQIEVALAPHWAFTISDMYNVTPGKQSPTDENGDKLSLHYPRFDVFYTHRANRFSASYVKQVEGIVCTGGICRLEPAFSGYKFSITTSF